MKTPLLAAAAALLFTSCTAWKAQHASGEPSSSRPAAPVRTEHSMPTLEERAGVTDPLATRQVLLISEIDKYISDLAAEGKYDCCVKPACRQCAITAGECHCRQVISADGPCCGECTQSWVEGRGNTEGVDREQVLAHLGCVRELYEKKTPEGVTPPAQRKDQ
jgi:hypothetical protein